MSMERVWNRVRSALAFGSTTVVDDSGPVQTAQVNIGSLETHDNVPIAYHYGFSSNPPAGCDAVLSFVAGDRSNAVITATNHQTYRMKGLAGGDVVIYDNRGQSVHLTATGIVVNGGGNPVKITNTPLVRMESSLQVTGDITDLCDAQSETLAQQRQVFDTHKHLVHNVTGGTDTVETDVPEQQEV